MPRKQRRSRRPRQEYHEGHRLQLKIGADFGLFGGPAFGNGDDLDFDAARAAWAVLQAEIVAEHMAEHPCTRPWAWWHLEPRELRRRVDGGIHPCEDPDREVSALTADSNGRLRAYYGTPCRIGYGEFEIAYESVPAYLSRLNLLTRREREHLEENPDLLEPVYPGDLRGF